MPSSDHFTNPYDAQFYDQWLLPYQTDGFVDWSTTPGLTLADLTFPQLLLIIATLLGTFILSTISLVVALFFAIPIIAGTIVLSRLRRVHGPRYISNLMWLRNLPPPDGFYPFERVPPGELRKIALDYRRNS